ncbi:MAG: dipeptide epimerase [Planctomycetales bacterium]|nr:dipeptide epimerase [Planctomycetales bacterium]
MKLSTHCFELPLKHTFTISRESTDIQPSLVVELSDGTHSGYGEATTNSYYRVTLDSMRKSLDAVQELVAATEKIDPETFWQAASRCMPDDPFALCALDEAAHDLWGKQQGAPVYQLWNLDPANNPVSCFTIGIADIPTMVRKMQEVPGWPIYKIKLGTEHDLEIIRELRQHTPAVFRVDANCGWNAEQAVRNSVELKKLNVEFIEQPLPRDDRDGAKHVYENSVLPIVADESCISAADVQQCHGRFHGINIKLVKCGGLTPARRMIAEAHQLGMKVMVGCMVESTVGISAIAQLLPLLDYVDMDGAELISQDVAAGVKLELGRCLYPPANGSGVQLL